MHINFRTFFLLSSLVIVLLLGGLRISQASALPMPGEAVAISLSAPAFAPALDGGIRLVQPAAPAAAPAGPLPAPASEAELDARQAAPEPVYSTDVAVGEPVLPHRLVTLILPPDADLNSLALELEGVTVQEAPGLYHVPLSQPRVKGCAARADTGSACTNPSAAPPVQIGPNGFPSGTNLFAWPARPFGLALSTALNSPKGVNMAVIAPAPAAEPVTLLPYGQMRKWKLARLDYRPFRYDPASGKLYVTEAATVRVTYRRDPALLDHALLSDFVLDDLAPQIAENYAEAKIWYEAALASLGGPLASTTDNDYLILSMDAIYANSNLSQYITFLREHGHSVTGLSTSRYGGKSGAALADAIRADLQALYPAWHLRYVLLVGNPHPDSGDVPMRMMVYGKQKRFFEFSGGRLTIKTQPIPAAGTVVTGILVWEREEQ